MNSVKFFTLFENLVNAVLNIGSSVGDKHQSDWNEADSTAPSFIKNKPHILTVSVSNITSLTAEQLNALKPGDVVEKITGNQKHTYIVSYKGDGAGEGICLSYNDAGYSETVSYDRIENGWQYNSTDAVPVPTKTSDLTNDSAFVDGTNISHIVKITQAAYDLITPDASTLYVIVAE